MIDINPAKQGVDNPQRRYTEKRPFERPDVVLARARLNVNRLRPHTLALMSPSPRGRNSNRSTRVPNLPLLTC
jgi:hypothetical protein